MPCLHRRSAHIREHLKTISELLLPKEKRKGVVPETTNCPACGDTIDVDANKVNIEKVKQSLETLKSKMTQQENNNPEETFHQITDKWMRLQGLVRHPYK